MIQIEYFSMKEFPVVNDWLSKREMPLWHEDYIPASGLIAYEDKVPIAVGFCRYCEKNIGIMDSFATNPTIRSELRHLALNQIIDRLLDEARDEGMTSFIGFSTDESFMERWKAKGFSFIPHQVMFLNT